MKSSKQENTEMRQPDSENALATFGDRRITRSLYQKFTSNQVDTVLPSSSMENYNNSPSPFEPISFVDKFKKQKFQDEMKELDLKIKSHENNIKILKAHVNKLDGETQTALGNDGARPGDTEDVIIDNILKLQSSAAALFCQMKYKCNMSDHSLIKDVVGVVATLGGTDDPRLSRVLAEYLGPETMLAVVCKTAKCAEALVSYNKDGSVDKNSGLYALAANVMGVPLEDRFHVFRLENSRGYSGSFMVNDPHGKLDLAKPMLDREIPTGFLGFAVNMVITDKTLRATLFYRLFSNLQVYRSRKDMWSARPAISNGGAVSLDGGIIPSKGAFVLGHQKRDLDVKFPVRSSDSVQTEGSESRNNMMKQTLKEWQIEQELLDQAKVNFELKKQEFDKFEARV